MQFTKGCASLRNATVDFSVQFSIVCDFAAKVGENIGHFQCCIFHGDLRLEVDGSWHRLVEDFCLLHADCESKTLGCFDKVIHQQLQVVFAMCKDAAVISIQ